MFARALSARLGKEQRRTIRATFSLITIVVVFLVCHFIKVAVSAYQVVQVGARVEREKQRQGCHGRFISFVRLFGGIE